MVIFNSILTIFSAWLLRSPGHASALPGTQYTNSNCRCFPGESCWPGQDTWSSFNESIGGRLVATTPIAAACHLDGFSQYNASDCKVLQEAWYLPETHIDSSSSFMAPFFTNNSCSPFTQATEPCNMGNYVSYSVNASGAGDYCKTLDFAQQHNIRLVIRNTGHDYNAKFTGAGGFALWTHYLQEMELKTFNGTSFSGQAFKFGAGVLVHEAYEFADSHGLTVVGGNGPTVGLVGGYSQGGGHGPLASRYGLAVDQVLEWEVVLTSGEIVSATAESPAHADLFLALSGGGGGTYGAVLSATVKAHPPMTLSTGALIFQPAENSSETFWQAVVVFLQQLSLINDAGSTSIWYITEQAFQLATLWGPGLSKAELDALLRPFTDHLDTLNLPYTHSYAQYPSFLEGFQSQATVEIANLNIGGRLIPRSLLDVDSTALGSVIRNITSSGGIFSGVSFNISRHDADVGVNPYWREAAFDAVVALPFNYTDCDENYLSVETITDNFLPQLERLTPSGAAYLNEADFQQPRWESTFYGANWDRLNNIKRKYDSTGLFYAIGAVGSQAWTQQGNGRLCRT